MERLSDAVNSASEEEEMAALCEAAQAAVKHIGSGRLTIQQWRQDYWEPIMAKHRETDPKSSIWSRRNRKWEVH